jgi:hypothetical protein
MSRVERLARVRQHLLAADVAIIDEGHSIRSDDGAYVLALQRLLTRSVRYSRAAVRVVARPD